MEPDAERRLVEQAARGDFDACSEIVTLHHARIYRFLASLARSRDRADDLTQETFASAWRGLKTFRGGSSLATWLHRVALGVFLDDQRRRKVRDEQEIWRDSEPSESFDPLGPILADEQARQLAEAVDRLPEAEREAVVLHYFQDLSLRDSAAVLDEPVGTFKWRISKALGRLRTILEADDGQRATGLAGGSGTRSLAPRSAPPGASSDP